MTLSVQIALFVLLSGVAVGTTVPWSDPKPQEECPIDGHETEDDVTSLLQNLLSVHSSHSGLEKPPTPQSDLRPGTDLSVQPKLLALVAETAEKVISSKNMTSLLMTDQQTKNEILAELSETSSEMRQLMQRFDIWGWLFGGGATALAEDFSEAVFGPLGPFLDCLKDLPPKYTFQGMVDFLWAKLNDGGLDALGPALYDTYLKPPFDEIEQWSSGLQQTVMADAEAEESAGPVDIMEHSWARINELADLPSMRQLDCVVDHILTPIYDLLKPTIAAVLVTLDFYFKSAWNFAMTTGLAPLILQIAPVIQEAVMGFVGSIDLGGNLSSFARGEASLRCEHRIHMMKGDLDAFVSGDTSRLDSIRSVDSVEDEIPEIAVMSVHDWMKSLLLDLRSKHVAPFLHKIAQAVVDLMNTGLHAINGLMGLIPFVGGLISDLFTMTSSGLMNWVVPKLVDESLNMVFGLITKVLDSVMVDLGWLAPQAYEAAENALGAIFAPLVPIMKMAIDIVLGGVRPIAKECDSYLANVASLALMVPS